MQPDDREAVSALSMRSKAVWGYTGSQMAVFQIEVDEMFEAADIGFVAELDTTKIAAYYTLVFRSENQIELDHLFVDAGIQRQGIGSQLLRHAMETARNRGFASMRLISDANAPGFYEKFGARRIGEIQSSLTGIMIPIMEIDLGTTPKDLP